MNGNTKPAYAEIDAANLIERIGNKVSALAKKHQWKSKVHGLLATDYIKSLVKGDGTAPDDLCQRSAELIYEAFLVSCTELDIAPGSYPGQRVGGPARQLATAS